MNITFDEQISWTPALEGVVTWATVDGNKVGCVLEGRVIAEYFAVENKRGRIKHAYLVNRAFLEEIVRDAIERGMVDERNELLLGKRELAPYFEKRAASVVSRK